MITVILMKKKLIINADDYGVSEDINSGIIQCYKHGAVTDMSLLAVGEAFNHACGMAKKEGIKKIGIHLALTGRFRPAQEPERVATLVTKDGLFPGGFIGLFAGLLLGIINKEEIYNELKGQIRKVKEEGFIITHVDSHQHVHIFAPMWTAISMCIFSLLY